MRVICKSLGGDGLLSADISSGYLPSSRFHLTVRREYAVYGLLFEGGVLLYLIEDDTLRPRWQPASLFAITCNRVSRFWRLTNWSNSENYFVALSFPEFIQSQQFFDSLTSGDPEALNVFYQRKQLADLEFPDPSIKKVARPLEGDWLQCPFCADGWQAKSLDALLRCPTCQKISNNPRYDGG